VSVPAADLQTFVRELESRGWLHRVRCEVDPILEVAEITDRVTKAGGPALLFERVRGSRFPLLINTYGTRERMCLALGDLAARVKNLVKPEIPTTLMEKLRKIPELAQLGSLPPKIVRKGVCQEVVLTDAADLTALPVIQCWPGDGDLSKNVYAHIRDIVQMAREGGQTGAAAMPAVYRDATRRGLAATNEGSEHARGLFADDANLDPARLMPPAQSGRYITLGAVFTKNPETGDRNIGMYRVQVFGPKLAAMHWHMHHDGARHYRKWRERGQRMPVAIALGGPALLPYAATAPMPPGIDETLFAGFLHGRAIELCPCVTQPEIEVPATAEFVIEGYIDPHDDPVIEGPFGDHTGFYSLADIYPRLHVTAITHRRDPIYPTTIVGKPPQEDFWLGKATERIFLPLLQTLIPDIIDYNLPMFGCFHNCAFVKIKKEYPFQARRVMSAIWGAGQMAWTKMIVVVDEHVDVHDENAVWFQVCSNVDPRRDVVITDGPLDILDHASPVCGAGGKIGFDATRKIPGEGPVRTWPEELEMSAEVKGLVSRRWGEYGFGR
jgi:4-hydroxy-3-polyprenylbenzoate decarboxylase